MARANSCTWDEADHTYAGYMQWKGDFGLNPEHPPLVKFLATLPIHNMDLKTPPMLDRPYRLQEAAGGRDFLFQNNADTILFRARMAASVLTVLLAVLMFLAAQEMFGTGAGFITLGLISLDPTLLAHSALVTTDAGQACFMFWAIYAFYRYIKLPTTPRLLTLSLIISLALATKHSTILLFPMLLLLSAVEILRRTKLSNPQPSISTRKYATNLALAFLVIGVISIFILWSWYGFRYAARKGSLQLNPTMPAQLLRIPSHFQASVLGAVAKWHLLPESYIYGFAHVLIQSKAFHSFVLGTPYPHPVWFYFPIAMLIKSTLTFLILVGVAVWAAATGRIQNRRELLYMVIPAAVYMVFAMAGGMNIGVRHVLPIYIFLSVAIAGITWPLIQQNRRWLYAVVALLIFQAVSVLHAFPAYVSYANEAFGGPANVHKYLSDSSAEWAQQLKSVKRYLDQRGIKNCWFVYFGQGVADYTYYGIPCKPLVTEASLYFDSPRDVSPSIDGPVLISGATLSGFEFGPGALNPYEQFKSLKPADVIDYGVFVYNGHFDIPLAAALSHVQKTNLFLQANNPSAALSEAQQAESLTPESAIVNETMAHALDANNRPDEARPYYQKALTLAQTIEPAFQTTNIPNIEKRLAANQK
jgi:4-amino-4-deoxy-L-arabinose transferase-like glycosyltransferase